jgi:integrase
MFSVRIPYEPDRKQTMAVDLSKVKGREALTPRREPYWQRLRPGCFLGFRPSMRGGAGTWIARAYDEDHRAYQLKALGDFGALPGKEQFAAAKKVAESFAELVEGGGEVRGVVATVADACRSFANGRKEMEGRFRRFVYDDPIAKVKLSKLRRHHTQAWRERLEARPALVSRRKKGKPTTRPRSPASVNRDQAVLRTALGRVLAPGAPGSEAAWQEPLKPIKNAVKRRILYLDRDQRLALLQAIDSEAQPFVRALCLLPLRPGAIAALMVAEFDKRTSELTVGRDKAGHNRRIKVPDTAARLFATHTTGRRPAASLFIRANGQPWDKDSWRHPIAAAAKAAKLPAGVTAYTLRHSVITDLVDAGLPLLTVAQISGTSAEMIERHYGHLSRDAATEALAGLAV